MKTHSSVVWIKVVTLISIVLMGMHRADLSLSEVETTMQFEIAIDAALVKINPEGPLNFLRGYIYQKMDCMYNKRFFAPQIDTKYSLDEYISDTMIDNVYIYNRNQQKDKAYKAQATNKMDVYAEKYHTHLIQLFPSPTGDITIETRGNQSFIQFLRAKDTEKHALQILALLLLFSEGVSIPIDVNNTVMKVYETDKKDEIYFTVSMEIPWINIRENKVENFEQKKVKQLINFFKENATNDDVLSMMVDECTKEEVMSGKFLDSPKFLIQSYIFGFIDTAERAKEFIQAVHTMTEKYAPKTETPSKNDSVYDRLFKPTSTETGTDCMALMKETQDILNTYRVFPFINNTQLPAYKSVPQYNRKNKTFSSDRLEDYSNCVECMILSVFCCLAYDPSDFTYKTDHMGSVSEELEEFFAPEENKSFDTTKVEFQKEWCRVVAGLDEPSIAYCKGRNELDCGLINMLLVIAEIVNISKEEKEKILGFAQSLKEQKRLNNELCDDIKEYTKSLFIRLSKTESLVVEFSRLKIDGYSNGRYDISGTITMSFEQSDIKNTIALSISSGHSIINMMPADMKFKNDQAEKINAITSRCKRGTEFIENLFALYVDYEMRKIGTLKNNEEFMKEQVRKTIKNNFADINRLLLIKKIDELHYKRNLFNFSIIHTLNQKLTPAHPLIRFTSNILGSTELDNWCTQIYMLTLVFFAGLQNGSNPNYPNINLSKERYSIIFSSASPCLFIDYILYCDMNVFIRWIKFSMAHLYNQRDIILNPLLDSSVNRRIFQYIFRDGTMKNSKIIDDIVFQHSTKCKDKIVSVVHLVWVVYLCAEETPNIELIKANLDVIQENQLASDRYNWYIEARSILELAIEKLNDLKDQLCRSEDDIKKLNFIMKELENR
ncbi:hypothetical protein NEAUS03_1171 [Nematocida ausubeli]|nr:hypothetical protein NEAUS03_1171 [Nematocida ausubeli]